MRLPEQVEPILDAVRRSPVVARGLTRDFWRHPDARTRVDAFMELGIALYSCDVQEEGLPLGYALIAFLFDWEAQCQASGWHAIENRRDTLPRTLAAFTAVGLGAEADAVSRAVRAWDASNGDPVAASTAYRQVRHAYSVDLDRIEYLAGYFVDNADALLYLDGD